MGEEGSGKGRSKLFQVELSRLGRKPHRCPVEVERSWDRLVATRKSVKELFETFNELRRTGDPRGPLSERQRDQARAAIVFTSAGIDACLRTLLRDTLPALLGSDGPAHGAFTKHYHDDRLSGSLTSPTKKAILSLDPRSELIELYVSDLTGRSIQGWQDLRRVRNALGISSDVLSDDTLRTHQDFFDARHEVVHELDLVDPNGKGSRSRRSRDVPVVAKQCDDALHLVEDYINPTASAIKDMAAVLD